MRWKKEIDFGKVNPKDVVKFSFAELVTRARETLDTDKSLIEETTTTNFEVVNDKGKVLYREKF
ncbi:MAG: hypothetical protein WC976_06765 [Caldisericia bacterium]